MMSERLAAVCPGPANYERPRRRAHVSPATDGTNIEVKESIMIQSVISAILGLVVGGVIFFPLGIRYRKNVSEKEISSAEEEGKRIINEAIKSAETKKKEALLEAKEEILKNRSEYEKEEKSRRATGKPSAAKGGKPGPQDGGH